MRTIKKAQTGDTIPKPAKKPMYGTPEQRAAKAKIIQENRRKTDSTLNSNAEKMGMTREKYSKYLEKQKRKPDAKKYDTCGPNFDTKGAPCGISKAAAKQSKKNFKKMKPGGMIKRADGSYSKRGLWDNLRKKAVQNKKTGAKPKAPTAAMLKQERKINSKNKK